MGNHCVNLDRTGCYFDVRLPDLSLFAVRAWANTNICGVTAVDVGLVSFGIPYQVCLFSVILEARLAYLYEYSNANNFHGMISL